MSYARAAGAWSGGKWHQQAGGKWWQQGSSSHKPACDWWERKLPPQYIQRSGGGARSRSGQWIDYGEQPRSSPSLPPSQQEATGDQKEQAAAQVVKLEEKIASCGTDPLFAEFRVLLEKALGQQKKLAVDTRSTAKKLYQKEMWVDRETRRLEAERKRIDEDYAKLAQRQRQLDVDIEEVCKLKSALSTEADTYENDDVDLTSEAGNSTAAAVRELETLAMRELELRRLASTKRSHHGGSEPSALEREKANVEADRLLDLQQQKRRKVEENLEADLRAEA